MKARIVITPAGQISVFTDEGTFEEGSAQIKELFKLLKASGINLDSVGKVEQHRHGPDGNHIHIDTHTHTH